MDEHDITQRVIAILTAEPVLDANGVPQVPWEFDATRADLEALIQSDKAVADLEDLAKAMDTHKEMLMDPLLANLYNEGVDVDIEPDPEIFEAIEEGDCEAVRAALQSCDVNAQYGKHEATALYHAMSSFEASIELMHLLLDAGADPRKGLSDRNVLHGLGFASLRGIKPKDLCDVIQRCVEGGANLEERTNKLQWTPLIATVSEWNPIATEALLLAGADINARAGDVEGVCFSGSGVMDFAEGHGETKAVLKLFRSSQ